MVVSRVGRGGFGHTPRMSFRRHMWGIRAVIIIFSAGGMSIKHQKILSLIIISRYIFHRLAGFISNLSMPYLLIWHFSVSKETGLSASVSRVLSVDRSKYEENETLVVFHYSCPPFSSVAVCTQWKEPCRRRTLSCLRRFVCAVRCHCFHFGKCLGYLLVHIIESHAVMDIARRDHYSRKSPAFAGLFEKLKAVSKDT